MTDTGCTHPDAEAIHIAAHGQVFAEWCSLCGSLRHAGKWRAPSGAVLPGWTCACGIFNGCLKGLLTECRSCGTPRLTTDTDHGTAGGTGR